MTEGLEPLRLTGQVARHRRPHEGRVVLHSLALGLAAEVLGEPK